MAGTHYPCSRAVFTAVNTGVILDTPIVKVEINYDVINNSACRSRWPVSAGVQNDTPTSPAVFTARKHGP